MRAGQLNRRVRLQGRQTTVSADGFSIENWVDIATLWAGLEPVTAREVMQATQETEKITHQVTVRYRTGMSNQLRFRYGSRVFLIHTLLDTNESHRELICLCEESVMGQEIAT